MRVVAITQIWPNRLEPLRTPFNVRQFAGLARRCEISVIAAVPHVPGARLLGKPERPAKLSRLPDVDVISGIETRYMRQLYVPKIVSAALPLYLASLAPHLEVVRRADVVLGTWAYPDGCASVLVARALGKACVVKVHGSDLNVVAQVPSARAVLRRVLPAAGAVVSVSAALSVELEALGVAPPRIRFVANGVDTSLFAPRDKAEARRSLGLPPSARVVVFVGRLEPQKGVGDLLEAGRMLRARVPDALVVLLGDGVSADAVNEAARASHGAILAPGARPPEEIARWLAACDVFTLPSWMEGTPNVVLEALASGRPVVATRVGGIPDVVPVPATGVLVAPRDPAALATALALTLERVRAGELDPESVRAHGPRSWEESADALFDVLESVLERR